MSERAHIRRRGAHRETSRAHREGVESRRVANEIVRRVIDDGAYADLLLGEHLPAFLPPDRRLVTRIVLGTIAWLGRLDYELEKLTERPLDGIQPAALAIMRTALYQLRFLDRTPAHAVVDTAVTLAKETRDATLAAGFINAVLRRATRETIALPPREQNETRHLSIKWSHPKWMVERFIAWFGAEVAEHLMEADNEAAPNVIRLNLARGTREEILARLESEGFEIAAGGRSPETAILASAALMDSRAFAEGLFQPQSETSQLVSRMLTPAPEAIVADCAAAPGGKSTHLAELAGASARVVALDQNLHGLASAWAIAKRLGHHNVAVVRADVTAGVPLKLASFTHVLLDAPCTGLGTMREHPEIRWRLKPGDPARMATLQLKMLESAAALVKPSGAIVYSVCSIAPEEGTGVVDAFLGAHREFEIDRRPPNYEAIKDLLDERGALKTRPDIGSLDGFFAMRMLRRA
jgi:16S rRNA (cytosine967-C5)-methyltransferase